MASASPAGRFERALRDRATDQPRDFRAVPGDRHDTPLVTIAEPSATLSDVVLHPDVIDRVHELRVEIGQSATLASHGLRARNRLLFVGPPGCGKSLTGEALISELGLLLARVSLSAIVSSFLGDTARHLADIMDFATRGGTAVLFDEVDMLAQERSSGNDHGEVRRTVAAFLQIMESMSPELVLIATTNHPEALDSAIWRRFDDVLVFEKPTQREIESLLKRKLARFRTQFSRRDAARQLKGCSHAQVEMACHAAARRTVLAGREIVDEADIRAGIAAVRRRHKEVDRYLTSRSTSSSTSNR